MNDRDDFLSRWSRRKREAAEQASGPESPIPPQSGGEGSGVGGAPHPDAPSRVDPPHHALRARGEGENKVSHASDSELAFDITKLPSLDSIGPSTDIRMFLQPGVPASLSRAALRRAWSADPAIRDFIGLSENSWDFTAPDQVAGFGPMLPTDNVKEMLAQIFGGAEKSDSESTIREVAERQDEVSQKPAESSGEGAHAGSSPATESASAQIADTADTPQPEELPRRTQDDFASQQEEPKVMEPASPNRRRHGGALPT